MPIYEYKCNKCGKIWEILHIHTKEPFKLLCDVCNEDCDKIVSKSNFKVNGFNAANNYSTTEK